MAKTPSTYLKRAHLAQLCCRNMKRLIYPPKFYLFGLILNVLGIAMAIVALVTLVPSEHTWVMVIYVVLLLMFFVGLGITISDIQWAKIDDGTICVKNIFGVISRLEMSKIQTIKVVTAVAFSIKMYSKRYSCIVLSSRKSVRVCDIPDAYNHKKAPYIIFPNTVHNKQMLQKAYFEITGNDIVID